MKQKNVGPHVLVNVVVDGCRVVVGCVVLVIVVGGCRDLVVEVVVTNGRHVWSLGDRHIDSMRSCLVAFDNRDNAPINKDLPSTR